MIEWTEEQVQAVAARGPAPPMVVDPTTHTAYVLLRLDVDEQLTEDCDNSLWNDQEMDAPAIQAGEMLDSFG